VSRAFVFLRGISLDQSTFDLGGLSMFNIVGKFPMSREKCKIVQKKNTWRGDAQIDLGGSALPGCLPCRRGI